MSDGGIRTALVTGAASGIGAATARRLVEDGAMALVLVDRDEAGLHAVERTMPSQIKVMLQTGDIADPVFWARIEGEMRERFGVLDQVVANAGVADSASIAEMSWEAWRRVLSVNLDGVFLTLQIGMRLLKDGGGAVVVGSAAAVKAEAGVGAYAASKAGAVQLAKVAAKEGAVRGVRVNAVLPGGVETPIWRDVPFFNDLTAKEGGEAAAFAKMAAFATPLGRFGTAEEVRRTDRLPPVARVRDNDGSRPRDRWWLLALAPTASARSGRESGCGA